jgi:MEDS: MEthanogen/methylotroph, DcmR Sensory domain
MNSPLGPEPWPAAQSWLVSPSPGQHIAQLYPPGGFPDRALGEFVGAGLRRGEAVIVIATPAHWDAVARRLGDQRFDLPALQRDGALTVLDAAACLAMLMVDGAPDRDRFRAVIGGAVDAARRAGYRDVRAFGEMVDLLRRADPTATLRLEELWTEILAARRIALVCGYSIDVFEPDAYRGPLQRVCAAHTDLAPVEDGPRLERAVARAYVDVFGPAGDADSLRGAFLAEYVRPAAMPDAEAAVLAAWDFVPMATRALLERARHHYRSEQVRPT